MWTFVRATASDICCLLALVVGLSTTLGAAPQPPAEDAPVSLDRIREGLTKPPPLKLETEAGLEGPVATFKVHVEQRVYMLSFREWINQEFELNDLQRQSADWASKCCGVRLDPVIKSVQDALERRRVRKVREEIARELAELEAARKKRDVEDPR